jgi:hypothetical protein
MKCIRGVALLANMVSRSCDHVHDSIFFGISEEIFLKQELWIEQVSLSGNIFTGRYVFIQNNPPKEVSFE